MSLPRFYCPPPLPAGGAFELPRAAAHHAHRVLRLRVNDPVQIFDGAGHALDGKIREVGAKRVLLHELQTCLDGEEPPMRITLAQAMCSSEKMDWIVQKATELGAAAIQPIQTRRSVARLAEARAQKRLAHWREVAISACEQCGRNALPQLSTPQDLAVWLDTLRGDPAAKFVLQPEGAAPLHKQAPPWEGAILLIGPEGGFTEDELKLCQMAGFVPVRMGKRILRTETAAIAGLAALQTLWGEFV